MCSGVLSRGSGMLQGVADVFLGHRFSRSMTRDTCAVLTLAVGGSSCTSRTSHDSQASWIVAFFILEICVAEGVSSQSPWSNSSLSPTVGAEPAAPPARRFPQDHQRRASPRRGHQDVPLVYRCLRLCVAPLCRARLETSCLSLSGGICRDDHDVGYVGKYAVPYSETSTSRGGIPQKHPSRFRRSSGNHRDIST